MSGHVELWTLVEFIFDLQSFFLLIFLCVLFTLAVTFQCRIIRAGPRALNRHWGEGASQSPHRGQELAAGTSPCQHACRWQKLAAQGRAAFARGGLSCRRRGLGKRTDSSLGRPPELGFEGHARVIVSWVWVSRFGVLQVSAGSAQIVSACEKLYSSIAVSKN